MSAYVKLADIRPLPIWDGVLGRSIDGANITLGVLELAPNCVVPEHQHHNEQLGVVLQGSLTFTIGGERRELVAGDTYNIPGNVLHGVVTGPKGAVVIDVFAPVRSDWSHLRPETPRQPLWP